MDHKEKRPSKGLLYLPISDISKHNSKQKNQITTAK